MNAPGINKKIAADAGRAARLAASDLPPAEGRRGAVSARSTTARPTPRSATTASALFDGPGGRRRAAEDLLWALINSPEFVFED